MADTPDGKTYTPEASTPDGMVQIGDDLTSEAKETLASYLSSLTADPMEGNAFPILPDNPVEEFKLTNADGTPAAFETGGTDTTEGFTRTFPEGDSSAAAAVPKFETLSNSGKFDLGAGAPGASTLADYVDKNSQMSGNDLLRSFVSTEENDSDGIGNTSGQNAFPNPAGAPDVQKKISMILTQGNRFDPLPSSSPYIENGEMSEPGIPVEQGAFGVYDSGADRTSIQDLRKVALGMMLRATGHAYSGNPGSANVGPATGVQKGSAKVSTKRLMAKSQWSAPDRPSLVDAELEYDDRTGDPLIPQPSVGVLNSYKEQFGNHVIRQMRVTIATLGELLLAAAVFAAVMTLLETVYGSATIPAGPHQMKKGMHRNRNLIQRLIVASGVPITQAPMWKCICYGIAAFFKIPESMLPPIPISPGLPGGPVAQIGAWFAALVLSAGPGLVSIFFNMQYASGYYATILRVMRQDLERLLDVFSSLPTASPGAAAFAIYNLILNLNNFASWRFFCTLAIMGDRWIESRERTFAEVRSINNMPDNGQTRQAKSRVTSGNPALAWRHRSSPAVILLPHKLRGAYSMYGFSRQYAQRTMNKIGDSNSYNAGQPYTGQRRRVVSMAPGTGAPLNGRIPQWLRESVERELNSEYCPFYFHDLRTNEVISFHAFLEDLTDSYSVSYAESSGYGRIDPVKIYQNTSRSVSLTWTLVATSREDFDSMWWSINKLVSMCYPQFSMGKPLQAGTKKFIMPFSQIPTSSPVIRLRVGDVIRSNYSRFNLARIFGLSEGRPAHGVDAPGATGATTDPAAIEEGSNAPFDLTYTESMEDAIADAATETAMELAAIELGRSAALSAEPTSPTDFGHGYQVYASDFQPALQLGRAYLKANSSTGYTCYDTDELTPTPNPSSYFPPPFQTNPAATHTETTPWRTRTTVDGLVKIKGRRIVDPTDGDDEGLSIPPGGYADQPFAEYAVQMVDVADPADPYHPEAKGHFHTFIVTAADLYPVPPFVEPAESTPDPVSLTMQVNDIYDFFHPDNNAIVRSFEAAGGQGLAGVITSFDMDWGEAMWDMSDMGRRAPQFIKCSVSFSPIHDIVPGLDNNGAMRALNYPVGKINSGLQEDFFDYGAARGVAGRLNTVATNLPDSEAGSTTRENFRENVENAYGFNADEPGID